jgi:microcystin-dependent protein
MAEPFMGQIGMMAFPFAPKNYAFCNGQLMSVSQNQALFALLGTQYGGDGNVTFALPNLQGVSPVSAMGSVDASWQPPIYAQGTIAGLENVTLLPDNVASHTHMLLAGSLPATDTDPVDGEVLGVSSKPIYAPPKNLVPLAGGPLGSGASAPHPNMQPFLVINMCIALSGVFPSRN